jgi:hypothetical protein
MGVLAHGSLRVKIPSIPLRQPIPFSLCPLLPSPLLFPPARLFISSPPPAPLSVSDRGEEGDYGRVECKGYRRRFPPPPLPPCPPRVATAASLLASPVTPPSLAHGSGMPAAGSGGPAPSLCHHCLSLLPHPLSLRFLSLSLPPVIAASLSRRRRWRGACGARWLGLGPPSATQPPRHLGLLTTAVGLLPVTRSRVEGEIAGAVSVSTGAPSSQRVA